MIATKTTTAEKHVSTNRIFIKFLLLSVFVFVFFLSSWAQKPPYTEDLRSLRPKVTDHAIRIKTDTIKNRVKVERVTPIQTVNTKVDHVLDSIDRFHLTRRFVDGYTIQIYSGQSKESAVTATKKLTETYADLNATIQYQQPKFKVTVGKYFTRLEAQKDLLRLKRLFSSTILVPERIMIK